MSKIIPPSVGRKVWYWPSLDEVAASCAAMAISDMAVVNSAQPFDATVLCVHGDRCVNLEIIDHEGRRHFRSSARLRQPGDDKPDGGYAEWMPYQVSQAGVMPPAQAASESAGLRVRTEPRAVGVDLARQEQAAQTKPRTVTREQVEAEIASEHFFTAAEGAIGNAVANGDKPTYAELCYSDGPLGLLTICVLVLKNGHKVVGINYGAIDPSIHSAEMGREEAREDAICQVFKLLGFRLRDELAGEAVLG